jgi:pantoate--beta-alanine ligase
MKILRTLDDLQQWRDTAGGEIGFVPTMGALHDGHLHLIHTARQHQPQTIVSIFVNPLQFGPNEDFDRYPRTEEADVALLTAAGVDAVFIPAVETLYPQGYQTRVAVGAVANELCGQFRPGHFDGVATVLVKLFTLIQPQTAYFGEKDYQQLHIVRRMVVDFNLPLAVTGVPIVREADGLALSSRNRYLTPQQRAVAAAIPQSLQWLAEQLQVNSLPPAVLCQQAIDRLLATGYRSVDYLEVRDASTLALVDPKAPLAKGDYRLLVAARLGEVPSQIRLIDNLALTCS